MRSRSAPKTFRNSEICPWRLFSSTTRSGHTRLNSSSLVSTAPSASMRARRVSNARPPTSVARPSTRSSRRWRTTVNRPNSMVCRRSTPPATASMVHRPDFSRTNQPAPRTVQVLVRTLRTMVERRTRMFLDRLAARGCKPVDQLSPLEARQLFADIQSRAPVDRMTTEVVHRTISVDRDIVRLTVVRPAGAAGALPVFMFFPGGGWMLGDFSTHERMVRDLVAESATAAVCVGYDRSPEAPYPAAIRQAYAATRWVAEHGGEIGLDGRRLGVVGNSAGGNLGTVVSLMAKDR